MNRSILNPNGEFSYAVEQVAELIITFEQWAEDGAEIPRVLYSAEVGNAIERINAAVAATRAHAGREIHSPKGVPYEPIQYIQLLARDIRSFKNFAEELTRYVDLRADPDVREVVEAVRQRYDLLPSPPGQEIVKICQKVAAVLDIGPTAESERLRSALQGFDPVTLTSEQDAIYRKVGGQLLGILSPGDRFASIRAGFPATSPPSNEGLLF